MKTKAKLLVAVGILAGIGLAAYCLWQNQEPTYEGRSLSMWLENNQSFSTNILVRKQAETAIRTMGPTAVPHLIRMVRCRDSLARKKITSWASSYPSLAGKFRPPAEVIQTRGFTGVIFLGPVAKDALPDLMNCFSNANQSVRAGSISAAASIKDPKIIPNLIHALDDSSPVVRLSTLEALTSFGISAKSALPAVTESFATSHYNVLHRFSYLKCLAAIDPDSSTMLTKLAIDRGKAVPVRKFAIGLLAERAINSKDILATLQFLVTSENSEIRESANIALLKITGLQPRLPSPPAGDNLVFYFPETPVYVVVKTFEGLTGKSMSFAQNVPTNALVKIYTPHPVSADEAVKLFEDALREQAGLVISPLDAGTLRVTLSNVSAKNP